MHEQLINVALAVFGSAFSLSQLAGPFGLFRRWRTWWQRKYPGTFIAEGVSCAYCISFSLAILIASIVKPGDIMLILSAFGLSCLLISISERRL